MAYDKELPFDEWVNTLPASLRNDPLWKSAYYHLAMYLYDLVWLDSAVINKDFRGREIVHQVVRSAGSVCADMEEAYRRGIGTADFVRIMRIALGELGGNTRLVFPFTSHLGSRSSGQANQSHPATNCADCHSH